MPLSAEYQSDPVLSVIVPVYNASPFLEKTLNSILNQNPLSFEIVCVDDGSTDNSLKLLRDFQFNNSNITVVQHSMNKGLGAARNSGIHAARGEFVCFLDADDFMGSGFVESIVPHLARTDVDMLLTLPDVYYEDSNEYTHWMDRSLFLSLLDGQSTRKIVSKKEPRVFQLEVSSCRKVIRRQKLIDHSIHFSVGKLFEDFNFHFESLWCMNNVLLVNAHSFSYRLSQHGQITSSRSSRRLEIIQVLQEAYESSAIYNYNRCAKYYLDSWACNFLFWCFTMTPDESRSKFILSSGTLSPYVKWRRLVHLLRWRPQRLRTIAFFAVTTKFPLLALVLYKGFRLLNGFRKQIARLKGRK